MNPSMYTTDELMYYASIDSRYAPLLAARMTEPGEQSHQQQLSRAEEIINEMQDEINVLEEKVRDEEYAKLSKYEHNMWVKMLEEIEDNIGVLLKNDKKITDDNIALSAIIDSVRMLHKEISYHDYY